MAVALARGAKEIDVWMRVLAYFVGKLDVPMVKRALRHIDQSDVVPPLLVLRILSTQVSVFVFL